MRNKFILTVMALTISLNVNASGKDTRLDETKTSMQHIDAMKEYLFETQRFTPNSDQDVVDILIENKLLTEAYMKLRNKSAIHAMKDVVSEAYFAKAMIKLKQKLISIPAEVVKSYYLDHIDEYKMKPIIDLDIMMIKSLDTAFDVFNQSRLKTYNEVKKYAQGKGVNIKKYRQPVNRMPVFLRKTLRNYTDSQYFTPPQHTRKGFMILYVKSVEPQKGYWPFEKAKKEIEKKLYKQSYLNMRKKLVAELKNEN